MQSFNFKKYIFSRKIFKHQMKMNLEVNLKLGHPPGEKENIH